MAAKQRRLNHKTILELFKELELDDDRKRDTFLKLSATRDWSVWEEELYENQDTRGNTAV